MTSGPCLVLALQQAGAVKRLLDLLGPEEPQSARRLSQFLWRGEFGRDIFNNGMYCSSTYIDAVEDIKALFPDGLCCEDSQLLTAEQICAPAEDSIVEVCSNTRRRAVPAHQCQSDAADTQENSAEHQITVEGIRPTLFFTQLSHLTDWAF
ncbi:nucleoside diphosphate kinase [Plakobranchus ocellatus]|uniref:Nucleoside diphosphate kinase n=1 Tax=Plakobranchus ocellatus TaxID=259542 RepID=A0AAV3YT44_9GAST|nr:nucleoside diphosphate kinase [Plakobranchus ocellatus]